MTRTGEGSLGARIGRHMENFQKVLTLLVSHFDKSGWPTGVGPEKLWERARVASFEESAGIAVVEIERHRAVVGASYIRGVGMNAFEEYFMRYSVDVVSGIAHELAERHGRYGVNVAGLVDEHLSTDSFCLSISCAENGCFEIREDVSHESSIVSNLNEAREFVQTLGDLFSDCFSEILLGSFGENISSSTKQEMRRNYDKALTSALLEQVDRLWESREE